MRKIATSAEMTRKMAPNSTRIARYQQADQPVSLARVRGETGREERREEAGEEEGEAAAAEEEEEEADDDEVASLPLCLLTHLEGGFPAVRCDMFVAGKDGKMRNGEEEERRKETVPLTVHSPIHTHTRTIGQQRERGEGRE